MVMTALERRSQAARKGAAHRWTLYRELPTHTQRMVLAVIRDYIARHGMSPTLKEIAQALGYASHSGVARIVGELERKGFLTRRRRGWQSIKVTQSVPKVSRSPLPHFASSGLLSVGA